METVKKVERDERDRLYDRVALFMRNISGFSSCLTVCMISFIFVVSIHLGVTEHGRPYPGLITMTLMIIGPIIMAWSFNNARSIISTILVATDGTDEEIKQKVVIPKSTPIITEDDIAIERGVVGRLGVGMRYFAGCVSTHIICWCSLVFTWTIHVSYTVNNVLPSNAQLFLVVVGPIVTSWNFVRASATLSTVIQGASQLDKWRGKIAGWISPNKP